MERPAQNSSAEKLTPSPAVAAQNSNLEFFDLWPCRHGQAHDGTAPTRNSLSQRFGVLSMDTGITTGCPRWQPP
jgi:hypothetical protein